MEQVLIIGSGPAGLTAALYAGRAQLAPVVISGNMLGGQAASASEIENYPGFPNGITGLELMQLMQAQAERFGARLVMDTVEQVDLRRYPFTIKTFDTEYQARTLIVTTGVTPRTLGVPGEAELRGRGVSYCATCDGFFYRDKVVVVVGGGESALGEAIFLTRFASQVYLVHRRDRFRAPRITEDRVRANPKITTVMDSVVTDVLGCGSVSGVRLQNVKTGAESTIEASGVFVYVGSVPNTQLFVRQLELDPLGYIVTDRRMHTNVPGVFAAGDVQERVLKQVSVAVGTGALAAMEAEQFLAEGQGQAQPERNW